MKKVMILAPAFNQYTEMFCDSIQKCGYEVTALSFKAYNWRTALSKMIFGNDRKVIEKEKRKFNHRVVEEYKSVKPDFVIVIRGDYLKRDTLIKMCESCLSLWLYDSVCRYPETENNWELYDKHYVFEESDLKLLHSRNHQAEFLPLGYDDRLYYPVENMKKTIDISFVGAMYGNRKRLLEQLAADFPDLSMEFYGIYVFKRNFIRYLKYLRSPQRHIFKNRKISHEETNLLYAKSKINLNILHEQSKAGWNARLNEILGAGAFQIVTYNPMIEKMYHGKVVTYKDYEELKKKISYYLKHIEESEKFASTGYEWVIRNATYRKRFDYILKSLEQISNHDIEIKIS